MRRAITLIVALCAALTVWGCQEASPEEKVAKARARYTVTLNGFFEKEAPTPEPTPPMEEGEETPAMDEGVEPEGEEGDEGMGEEAMEPVGPTGADILLDLIVQHDMDEALPGITVDLTLVDPNKTEKASWRIYIETAGLPKANQKQVTHVLEDIDYEEGDAFSVEIVSGVPADLAAYQEFGGAP